MDIFSIQDDLQTARFKQSKPHIFYFASSFTARVPSLHQAAAWNCAGNFLHNLADKHSLVTHQHERDRGGGIMRPLNATAFSAFFTEEIVCCVVTHLIFWTPFSKHTHHFSCEGTRCVRCRAPCCPAAGAGCRWCSDAPVNPEEKNSKNTGDKAELSFQQMRCGRQELHTELAKNSMKSRGSCTSAKLLWITLCFWVSCSAEDFKANINYVKIAPLSLSDFVQIKGREKIRACTPLKSESAAAAGQIVSLAF